jgi:isopentenyl-diphosphate delta-isomerase
LQHRIVSYESEELILVDESDNELGHLSKADCHDGDGVLHRAFSVFVFDDLGRLILQQRGSQKRLWPGYWSNSCCSHPRKGEGMDIATVRRLEEELGIAVDLEFVYRFQYQAGFGEFGSENELCSVFLGRCTGAVKPNETEIDAVRFVDIVELQKEMEDSPCRFTPWFKQELNCLLSEHAGTIKKYLAA